MILKWLWKLTGGRPMKFIRYEFVDVVIDRPVNSYMDRNGKFWMAYTKWDWDRMHMDGKQIMDALGGRNKKSEPEPTGYGGGGGGGGGGGSVLVTVYGVAGGPGGFVGGGGPGIQQEYGGLTFATVVQPDGSSRKEVVAAAPFQALLAEGLAMLDAAVYPDVSLPDDN